MLFTNKMTLSVMIGDEDCLHEGYVMDNKYGMFKIVIREVFSRANFTTGDHFNIAQKRGARLDIQLG